MNIYEKYEMEKWKICPVNACLQMILLPVSVSVTSLATEYLNKNN